MAKRRNPQSVVILSADDEEIAAGNPLPVVAAAGDSAIGRVKITDGTDVADVVDLATYNGLAVAIVDGSGNQITSFGGGTQYTEDAAAAADPVGTAVILVRDDVPGALVTTDGDNVAARGTNYGAMYVTLLDSTGTELAVGGGTQHAEDDPHTTGDIGNLVLAVRQDVQADFGADGDYVPLSIDADGALRVAASITPGAAASEYAEDSPHTSTDEGTFILAIRNDAGTVMAADGDYIGLSATSDGSVRTYDAAVLGSSNSGNTLLGDINTELQLLNLARRAEDVASAAGHTGFVVMAIRDDTLDARSTTEGDYEFFHTDANGALWTQDVNSTAQATAAKQDTMISSLATIAGDTTDIEAAIEGYTYVDDADWTDNTSKHALVGGVYQSAPHTVTDGDVTPFLTDVNGRLATLTELGATDNAVLDAIAASVAAIDTDATTIIGHVDGIETAIASTNTKLDTVITAVQLQDDTVYTDDTSTHATGTSKGTLIMAAAVPTDTAVNANDIGAVGMTVNREMYVSLTTAIPAGNNNIGDVDIASIAAGNNNIGDVDIASIAAGDNNIGNVDIVSVNSFAAHDAGIAGVPLIVGGVSQSLDGTAPPNRVSAEAEATRLAMDFEGGIFAHPHGAMLWSYHDDDAAAVTTDGVITDPGDGFALFITDIVWSIGAATASTLYIEEGATKVLGPFYLPATIGAGMSLHFMTPKRITASTAALVTNTGSIVFAIDIHGFTAAV